MSSKILQVCHYTSNDRGRPDCLVAWLSASLVTASKRVSARRSTITKTRATTNDPCSVRARSSVSTRVASSLPFPYIECFSMNPRTFAAITERFQFRSRKYRFGRNASVIDPQIPECTALRNSPKFGVGNRSLGERTETTEYMPWKEHNFWEGEIGVNVKYMPEAHRVDLSSGRRPSIFRSWSRKYCFVAIDAPYDGLAVKL